MSWNSSIANSAGAAEQPTKVFVKIGGAQTVEEDPATVNPAWIAAKAREMGWTKFICTKNGVEVDSPSMFTVVAGDKISVEVYDEFGS